MRLYTSKSSAVRAAKKAGLSTDEYEIIEEAGKFGFRAIKADEVEEQVVEEEAAPEEVDETPVEPEPAEEEATEEEATSEEEQLTEEEIKSLPVLTIDSRLRKSTIESPSKRVWEIADQMKAENPNVRRKDVIAACVEQGIAYYTARTQYQLWFKANKAS